MNNLFVLLPLIIVLILLAYTVIRNIVRLWLDHRVKVALLERLEQRPDLVHSVEELHDLLEGHSSTPDEPKIDYVFTGVLLALMGIGFVVFNVFFGRTYWAAGAYFGGVVCIALGFLLAMIGLILRFMRQAPTRPEEKKSRWAWLFFWRRSP